MIECIAGVNLSLLSRVMSSRLSRGTYNGGLLSTEAGTIARVIADGTITLAGYLGVSRLLNITLLPSLLICIISIIATCYTYNSLFWFPLPWRTDRTALPQSPRYCSSGYALNVVVPLYSKAKCLHLLYYFSNFVLSPTIASIVICLNSRVLNEKLQTN